VIVSRGELVEIGGGFRIPDVLRRSGAKLVEVGTTNRTRLADYEAVIRDDTAALMRVHASNFRVLGFTEDVGIDQLCELGRRSGVFVIDDLGSGVLAGSAHGNESRAEPALERLGPVLRDEPSARASIDAGADVVCFSGDKLLGGPQAGIVAGSRGALDRMTSHPLARALRIDKLSLAALEVTLHLHRDPAAAAPELPVLRMLTATEHELGRRASSLREAITAAVGERAEVEVVRVSGKAGGGALPLLDLEGPAVRVRTADDPEALEASLRSHDPPVVARVRDDAVILDPRTMTDEDARVAAAAVASALR
jgi:L-seryl-tRNA(Ser) seleniumtransferase